MQSVRLSKGRSHPWHSPPIPPRPPCGGTLPRIAPEGQGQVPSPRGLDPAPGLPGQEPHPGTPERSAVADPAHQQPAGRPAGARAAVRGHVQGAVAGDPARFHEPEPPGAGRGVRAVPLPAYPRRVGNPEGFAAGPPGGHAFGPDAAHGPGGPAGTRTLPGHRPCREGPVGAGRHPVHVLRPPVLPGGGAGLPELRQPAGGSLQPRGSRPAMPPGGPGGRRGGQCPGLPEDRAAPGQAGRGKAVPGRGGPARLRHQRDHRQQPGLDAGVQPDRDRGPIRCHRPAAGRNGNRQGTAGPGRAISGNCRISWSAR